MKQTKVARLYPTSALEKGLDIVELFASEPAGLTKSDVARRLGRTVSEIFRMLVCLEERGYISPSRDGERFHLTLRLFELAQQYPPRPSAWLPKPYRSCSMSRTNSTNPATWGYSTETA